MNSNETEKVKRQLIENIETNFPKDKADVMKRQIMSMNDGQLEMFLKKSSGSECLFCSIASGKSESFMINEDDSAVAVLELNPASKGHVLIIPKEHIPVESFSSEIKNFAGRVAQILKDKLKPKDIEISSQDLGGHGVINLVPVHDNESINAGRRKAERSELEEISRILKRKEESKPEKTKAEKKPKPKKITQKSWLPKRIP
ncbi:MAG TPA: HIT domain-containing protein [Candidatus Omnitrophota bacterium]|nr:HIT domain-containing protein [Candidatus Omnitrophota bacterium]